MHSLFLRSAPADFSHPQLGLMIHQFLPLFPLSQSYSMSTEPHRLLFMDLFEVDSIYSGPAYFHPTGIFEVTCPKPKKKKYKKVDQCVKPVPTTLPEVSDYPRDYWRPASGYTYSFNSSAGFPSDWTLYSRKPRSYRRKSPWGFPVAG